MIDLEDIKTKLVDDQLQNDQPIPPQPISSPIMKNEKEIERLAGRTPLKTILFLMIGPVVSQLTSALYGIINTIWISRALGEVGMSAVGVEITLENFGRAFAFFMMVAGSTQISALFGKNLASEAEQVICDILRTCLICGIIVPVSILPAHNAMCKWFGASELTTKMGYNYISPICYGSVFTCINYACQGFLQAEGRTLLIGIIDVISLLTACGGITPLCLYVFHTGVEGPAIAAIVADAVPGIILVILYFSGVFGIKPKISQLLKPFNKHTYQALLVGSSQLVANLSGCIPGIPIRNLIGQSTGPGKPYDLAMDGFNVLCRFGNITNSVVNAACTALIPAASYAFAAGNYRRYLKLSLHAAWIACLWASINTFLTTFIPREIASLFGEGEEYLYVASEMLKASNMLGYIMFIRTNSQAMLQAMQLGTRAMIVSFLSTFVSNLGFAYWLFYTNKHNVVRLMWVYPLGYAFGLVAGVALLTGPLYRLYKQSKEQSVPETLLLRSRNDDDDENNNNNNDNDNGGIEKRDNDDDDDDDNDNRKGVAKELENLAEL